MLVRVEGLNPNDIKRCALGSDLSDVEFGKQLLAFLDDKISNAIPEDPDPSLQCTGRLTSSVFSSRYPDLSERILFAGASEGSEKCCNSMPEPFPFKDLFQILVWST
jgi:hypothetical protein